MTKKNKSILFVLLFFSAAIVLLIANKNLSSENMILVRATAEPEDSLEASAASSTETAPQPEGALGKTSQPPTNQYLEEKIKSFPQNIQQNYRQALEQEPHQTPDIVVQTAVHLGEIFDSVSTEVEAQSAFQFFAKCTLNDSDMVVALQTSCFRFAKDLAKEFPTLQNNFAELENKASDAILQIVKFDEN